MTTPAVGEFRFISGGPAAAGGVVGLDEAGNEKTEGRSLAPQPFPKTMIDISEERKEAFLIWLDQNLRNLQSEQSKKQDVWADYEIAYRAYPEAYKRTPFEGASSIVVPVIAMAVDPIHARLDTGIFKQDPPVTLKALRKDVVKYMPSVQKFFNYWLKHVAKLRQTASPRILECTKLGTMVFKTIYDREVYTIKTYDPSQNYKVIDRTEVRYAGPRILGLSIGDVLFSPGFQFLQDCPIVAERIRTNYWKLKIAEKSGKLQDVDKIKDQTTSERTPLEDARTIAAQHQPVGVGNGDNDLDNLVVYEIWCDYDIDGNDLPESIVCTYEPKSRTILQLRYNWYFNQKKPYVVIPYTTTNESLLGIGLCEMVFPFQQAITKWEQMAEDNAYIANIRMFIVKKDSDIEEVPRLYAGRCFFVDDPRSDFVPFASGDIYPSTLSERQNLFGLVEKRTGVSDYLTGRESPIIGSRATATSTLALIQEGTKRVEEVLENFRDGFGEAFLNCFSIWMQYGLEGLDEMVLGDDVVAHEVREFFDIITQTSVYGTVGIDLTATDASGNKAALQSVQLQLIQVMMGYYEKLLEAMSIAVNLQMQGNEAGVEIIKDTARAARKLFTDLLHDYNIRNPEEYLPELEKYLNGRPTDGGGPAQGGAVEGRVGNVAGQQSLPTPLSVLQRQAVPRPAAPGSGNGPSRVVPPAGSSEGT
jgi:hypothetical protein